MSLEPFIYTIGGSAFTLAMTEVLRRVKQSHDDHRNVNVALVELLQLRHDMQTIYKTIALTNPLLSSKSASGFLIGLGHVVDVKALPDRYNHAISLLAPTRPLLAHFLRGKDVVLTRMITPLPLSSDAAGPTEEERRDVDLFMVLTLKFLIPRGLKDLDFGIQAVANAAGRKVARDVARLLSTSVESLDRGDAENEVEKLFEAALAEMMEIKAREGQASSTEMASVVGL